jgi:sulfur-oxidizing protein SoxY
MLAVAATSGLLRPNQVLAAQWPKTAFESRNMNDAMKNLFGAESAADSKDIKIKAPLQAENGAKVPVTVQTSMPNVESIAIFVKENAMPLAGRANLTGVASGFFSTRIKMAKTSEVTAVVKSGGALHSSKMKIKVTVGGCGG